MKRRLILLFLSVCALLGLTLCARGAGLEETMAQFRQDHGLTEENFSICYYNTVTGEEYRWNDTHFMVAASTFKLPLNLYYYDQERRGEIAPDAAIGGLPLSDCHQESLVHSNNDVSLNMLYHLGNFRTYKEKMLAYFTLPREEIPGVYFADNYYCAAMMLDALKYLYENSDQFPEMLDYMKQAQPESYFRRDVRAYEIAHKYGFFEGAVNDVGIVYTPAPFLLAVYTQDAGGEELVAQACAALTDYTLARTPEPPPEPEPQPPAAVLRPDPRPAAPAPVPEPEPPAPPLPDPEPTPEQTARDNLWWMILVAASIFLVADLVVLLALKKGSSGRFWERYEKKHK